MTTPFKDIEMLLTQKDIHNPMLYTGQVDVMQVRLVSHSPKLTDFPIDLKLVVIRETERFPEGLDSDTLNLNEFAKTYYLADEKSKLSLLSTYLKLHASMGNSLEYYYTNLNNIVNADENEELVIQVVYRGESEIFEREDEEGEDEVE